LKTPYETDLCENNSINLVTNTALVLSDINLIAQLEHTPAYCAPASFSRRRQKK